MKIGLKVQLGKSLVLELKPDGADRWSDLYLQTAKDSALRQIGHVNPLYFIEKLREGLTGQLAKEEKGWFMTIPGRDQYPTLEFWVMLPQAWEPGRPIDSLAILIKKPFPSIRSNDEISWENISVGLDTKDIGRALSDLSQYDDPLLNVCHERAQAQHKDALDSVSASTLTKS